jgi:hypothetical protein
MVGEFDSDRLRIKQVVLDGMRYEISVSQFVEGFHRATWTCTECSETGAFAPISADVEHAIALAKVCVNMHHSLLHQRGPVLKRSPARLGRPSKLARKN